MTDTELLDRIENHMALARAARERGNESCAAKHEWAAANLLGRTSQQTPDHDHVKSAA